MSQPALPSASIDLRPNTTPPAPDQGARPTCLAMAATGAHDSLAASVGEAPRSAEALWWSAVQIQGNTLNGTTIPTIRAALAQTGQPEDAVWPYPVERLTPQPESPPAACSAPPWRAGVLVAFAVGDGSFETTCESHLAAGRPVILILKVTDDFDSPNGSGVISAPGRRAANRGAHAVLILGMQDVDGLGRHLIIRNSWGPLWGVAGYALLPLRYVSTHGVQASVVLDAP